MASGDIECLPLSRENIRSYATKTRQLLGFGSEPHVDVAALLEFILPTALPGYEFEVRDMISMGENHGLTNVTEKRLILREDVYDGVIEGRGRDRMTALHEVGHLLLHGTDRILHRRATGVPPSYRDPEWQAKAYAGEFLVSELFANEFGSVEEAAKGFGVSLDAARYQLKQLDKAGKIKRADLRSTL